MATPITADEVNRTTLARQQLLARSDDDVPAVVGRVGGLQAQHADMPYVALWARRAGQTIGALEDALTDGDVVKATVMRSTLHVVPSADWPLLDAVSAEQRLAAWRASARRAGVDLTGLNAAVRAFCAEPRTLDEVEAFAADQYPGVDAVAAIPGGVSRAWWRLASAGGGLVHVPPSGLWGSHVAARYQDGSRWLADRVSHPLPVVPPDEARARVVEMYLRAFGPASVRDVARGIGVRGVGSMKRALALLELRAYVAPDGRELLDLADAAVVPGDTPAPVRLLPRWDQLLVALDERSRIVDAEHVGRVYRRNADVLPTLWVDGRVAGTWSLDVDARRATVHLEPFTGDAWAHHRDALEAEAGALLDLAAADAPEREITWSAEPAARESGRAHR
ncbi:winged helix DNA-binding domain-containing protein [Krasilnikoviella flava]|uniref:Winged helix DNA-binding domain-containing protein n=1 Tax=Krasilnikoviella flava TaxID=526729 RepID=A0A1T5KPJ0_9MICO|nr:winged helix DNA-binding domain-containing protein [Krasilnikoviella flava]SKC65652.1 Winged helix DNA-binding domain-containing protein [Krasilnikoviella flava]